VSDSGASDEQLLTAARAGDVRALERLLERHQPQVYRFGMRMCRDREDAKDVLQDTLLAAARTIREFRGASSISTWLYAIARSFCIKRRRRTDGGGPLVQSVDRNATTDVKRLVDPASPPDEALGERQVERALEQAIADLEPMYREVLVLRDMEGLTAPEVAEVLGLSTSAVKSRLHRARLSLRAALAPLLGLPETARGTCPDVLTLFSQHLEDEISAEVCAQMESHLEACGRCRVTCDSLKRTLALCRTSAGRTEVPLQVQATVKTALKAFLTDNA
jgi:RNA polymerase sigma-70 factor (ECF subfamily)